MSARAYTSLCSSILFPLHEAIKGHDTARCRRMLEESQWWYRPQLEQYRVDRLRQFMVSVQEGVPYYECLFRRCGFEPARVQSAVDLARIPLLTKSIIRADP